MSKMKQLFSNDELLNKNSAGAGIWGTAISLIFFGISAAFYLAQSYFLCMFFTSVALLIYVTGLQFLIVLKDSCVLFLTQKHIVTRAADLIMLQKVTEETEQKIISGDFQADETIHFETNNIESLETLEKAIDQQWSIEKLEICLKGQLFSKCHEVYRYHALSLDFVGNNMPLFGLIGTIAGLLQLFGSMNDNTSVSELAPGIALAMETTLFGAVISVFYKILSSRFKQQTQTLEYDFDEAIGKLKLIWFTKFNVEKKQAKKSTKPPVPVPSSSEA